MESVVVRIELMPDGRIDLKTSAQDAAMVVLIMEKAKLNILEGIQLQKASHILTPGLN